MVVGLDLVNAVGMVLLMGMRIVACHRMRRLCKSMRHIVHKWLLALLEILVLTWVMVVDGLLHLVMVWSRMSHVRHLLVLMTHRILRSHRMLVVVLRTELSLRSHVVLWTYVAMMRMRAGWMGRITVRMLRILVRKLWMVVRGALLSYSFTNAMSIGKTFERTKWLSSFISSKIALVRGISTVCPRIWIDPFKHQGFVSP